MTVALADAVEDYLREKFKSYYGVEKEAPTPCIRRVITSDPECSYPSTRSWVDRERETVGDRDEPPHAPPHRDHAPLWPDEGEPVLYSMHIDGPES
ncbi:hypothetical protein C475_19013 [Halosimplex carlsbadense 2-9-1]|uniref:Uncharacterized protein n=1 Tax=Halosimplex carlsbadense 2-9-1 TaxID=797114 RepID=M0CGT1_9EURY|nr:hypothetical protein [Halosimplex carlsbadense]ELZ21079.1 hypothetical protein C475_19013 [Halosimplex carlsbadense 2-9-1]